MSNILIIKHGSLGDIAQACGAIQDIYDNHKDDFIYLLTSHVYSDLFKKNPNIKEVIVDKRLSRFNLIYLFSLMKKIKQHKFTKVYDLQNSSRTSFYKRILFPNLGSYKWSSSETTLPANETKKEFDKKPVLERFDHQLKNYTDFQGNAIINYTDSDIPHTRVYEHKHFDMNFSATKSAVTYEYPDKWELGKIEIYPVNTDENQSLFEKYQIMTKEVPNVTFGGRLGQYRYYDMHQVIASALEKVKTLA